VPWFYVDSFLQKGEVLAYVGRNQNPKVIKDLGEGPGCWGLGARVWGLGFGVWGLQLRFAVWELKFGSGFRVEGFGFAG
jgi:hypothetical protein